MVLSVSNKGELSSTKLDYKLGILSWRFVSATLISFD